MTIWQFSCGPVQSDPVWCGLSRRITREFKTASLSAKFKKKKTCLAFE